jgi:WD40 repeat protein
VGDDSTVIVWDARTGTAVRTLTGPAGQVQSTTATPDGTTLYTSSLDGELLAWDLSGDRQFGRTATLGANAACCSQLSPHLPPLAISPDGSQFAARVGPSSIGLFSESTLRRERTFTITPRGEAITALAWSPTAPVLAVAGHSGFVQTWDVAGTPRLERSLIGLHAPIGRPEAIQALAFSPDGDLLAATDQNETRSSPDLPALPAAFLAVWRTSTGALAGPPRDLEVGSAPSGSDPLAFSPNGGLLAAGLPDGHVLVLDPLSGQIQRTLSPAGGSSALAFGPDGTLAAGTAAGTVELWNPATGRRLAPALIAASAPITSIAFAPRGQRFATTGYQEGTVRLWFTSTLQQEGPALSTDARATSAAAFTPSGTSLLAVEDRGNAFAWPASLRAWEQRACAVAGRNLSRQEWDRLVAEPRYSAICP